MVDAAGRGTATDTGAPDGTSAEGGNRSAVPGRVRWRIVVGRIVWLVGVAAAALVVALAVTPMVSVTTFGQDVKVGAVAPSRSLGLSGPGQADLFGEGAIDTVQRFDGPIRPRIVWQRFEPDAAAGQFIQSTGGAGARAAGEALARGWVEYFSRLVVMAGLVAGLFYLAGVGVRGLVAGLRHVPSPRRHHLLWLIASVVVAVGTTAALTALTAVSAKDQLASVRSLSDLVGSARLAPVPSAAEDVRNDVDVVVIGDSTAAGQGNAPDDTTPEDQACQRSRDAYAPVLASASGLSVLNLACSGATVDVGLLGSQAAGGLTLDPQVSVLQSVPSARLVVVSVGANDVHWSDFIGLCYALPRCDDRVTVQLFRSRLDSFKVQYAQLLQQLTELPGRPGVLVNLYYDPFGQRVDCPALSDPERYGSESGFAPVPSSDAGQDPEAYLAHKVQPLRTFLAQMNQVLALGAEAFGFSVASPSFAGHELCTDQPWVQGLREPAPFHPRAAGELAIAAADLPAVARLVDRAATSGS